MRTLDPICSYCGAPNGQYEVYVIKQAIKPKFSKNRWKSIGYCCDDCYNLHGNSIKYEYGEFNVPLK